MIEGNDADVILPRKKNRPDWLVGRQGKSVSSTDTPVVPVPDNYVEELTAKITQNVELEMEAKVNRKVQENMAWLVKKIGEANPEMKIDFTDFCATFSSDADENGTPITPAPQGRTPR